MSFGDFPVRYVSLPQSSRFLGWTPKNDRHVNSDSKSSQVDVSLFGGFTVYCAYEHHESMGWSYRRKFEVQLVPGKFGLAAQWDHVRSRWGGTKLRWIAVSCLGINEIIWKLWSLFFLHPTGGCISDGWNRWQGGSCSSMSSCSFQRFFEVKRKGNGWWMVDKWLVNHSISVISVIYQPFIILYLPFISISAIVYQYISISVYIMVDPLWFLCRFSHQHPVVIWLWHFGGNLERVGDVKSWIPSGKLT